MTAAIPGASGEAKLVAPPKKGGFGVKGNGSNTAFAWTRRTAKASPRTNGTKGAKETRGKQKAVDRKTAVKDHLVVLVNGVAGSPMNWTYTKSQLEAHGDPHLLVHSCESLRRTVDGVDVVGNRLADEVRQVIRKNPQLRRISFIAHSLGGVLSRYAIAQMYAPACQPPTDDTRGHEPPSHHARGHAGSTDPIVSKNRTDNTGCARSTEHTSTTASLASASPPAPRSNQLSDQSSRQSHADEDCCSTSSCPPPPEEASPDTTFPTCASTSSLPSQPPLPADFLPADLLPRSPSLSALDVLRQQEEQPQLPDSVFPPMLSLDAEDEEEEEEEEQHKGHKQEEEQKGQGQGQGQGQPHKSEGEAAAAEGEDESAAEITSRSIDGGRGMEEEDDEEEEGEEEEEEKEEGEEEEEGGEYQGPRIAGLEPMNFITLASPHLGSRGKGHLPFLLRVSLFERASVPLAPLFLGRSARHLFLTDVDPQVDSSNGDAHRDTANADPTLDTTTGSTPGDTTNTDPPTGLTGADPSNDPSDVKPPVAIDGPFPSSSSVESGLLLADVSAKPTAAAAAAAAVAVGSGPDLGCIETEGVRKRTTGKQQQQHRMVRLHRLGSSMVDVNRAAAAEAGAEEVAEKGVKSAKVKQHLPLLLRMTTDNEEGPFLSALAAFKHRAAYANVSGDQMVGWRTASIRHQCEMPSPDQLHELPDYRFIVRVEPMGGQPRTPGAATWERRQQADEGSLHSAALDASHASAIAATAAVAAGASPTDADTDPETRDGPSGGPSGASSGAFATDSPEPKDHSNFFARLKGKWKGRGTAGSLGFGLGLGFGSPQQQFLPCMQQPPKLKEKGDGEQGEEADFEIPARFRKSPEESSEGGEEEGIMQLVRSMSDSITQRSARGFDSVGNNRNSSGNGSGEGDGSSSGETGRFKESLRGKELSGGEGTCGNESKARRASFGGAGAAAGAAGVAGGAGGAGGADGAAGVAAGAAGAAAAGAVVPRSAGIALKKHSVQMQWEDAMVDNLNRVPWARIDVNFASSPLAFLAHILIQVNIPSLKAHGASVIQHVIDNFVA
ncbi:hypothetical protein CLOM_g12766 [Closterium sp. NIES-68]|nr:hypothetical protein CLOM_g12766 [Closterium sp. NIES-68]